MSGSKAAGFDGDGAFFHLHQRAKDQWPNQGAQRTNSPQETALRIQASGTLGSDDRLGLGLHLRQNLKCGNNDIGKLTGQAAPRQVAH